MSSPPNTPESVTAQQMIQRLEQFLAFIFKAQIDEAVALCATDIRLVGIRPEPCDQVSIYGEYFGHSGVRQFFANFAALIDAGEFQIIQRLSMQNHVVLYGNFKHQIKRTGKPFHSEWCLVVRFNHANLLAHYHMYEDSAALETALRPD